MPVVYIDVLFAVNLIINYLLLRACTVFVNLKKNNLRIISGAFIGACYAVLIFFPDFSVLYTTISKMLVSMLIVAAAYPFYSFRNYIKTLFLFYAISFGFGGCVLGIFYFSDIGAKLGAVYSNGIFYFNLPWIILLISGGLFYVSVKLTAFLGKRFNYSRNLKKKLYLHYKENTAEVVALLDTGNSLIDPVSLTPVIVAEYRAIKNLFAENIRSGLDRIESDDITWIVSDLAEKGLSVRLIPFSSLGKENGMLIGFVPDHAEIRDECGIRTLDNCVVAIYSKQLSKDRSYGALLNPYV